MTIYPNLHRYVMFHLKGVQDYLALTWFVQVVGVGSF